MEDLAAWAPGTVPADLAWWLVGVLATQLYRVRRRAIDAEDAALTWANASKERDKRIAALLLEVEAERKRTDAIHQELIRQNNLLHTLRDPP